VSLDAGTFLLQWAVGGLAFLWVTGRRREVGLGYGWLLRGTYGLMAAFGAWLGIRWGEGPGGVHAAAIGAVAATGIALAVSVRRRGAGVSGQVQLAEQRSARVAEMTGIDRAEAAKRGSGPEFPPALDLLAPAIGAVGLVLAGLDATDPALSVARLLVGALFLGSVSDAMLLGHWYLVQPGLPRAPLLELVRATAIMWPFELLVMVWPPGMVAVLTGEVDDGYQGLLGWFWLACSVTTIVLVGVTRAALRERQYSAVMAATGLLYLAILTAFGMDLVARAVLAS
jgi:hypothetical protein